MSTEWKPGAIWLVEAGCWANRKVALRLTEGWAHVNGVNVDGDGVVTPVRPLAVIDPEDREQVERLGKAICDNGFTASRRLADALREFANPMPPKPEEPTGLGAVVEDRNGTRWVMADPDDALAWHDGEVWNPWSAIAAVRILSEGVQP